MVISGVPFITALLAEYIGADKGRDQVVLIVFTAWQLLLALLAVAEVAYTYRERHRLIRAGVSEAGGRTWLLLTAFGPLIWLVALASALLASHDHPDPVAVVFDMFCSRAHQGDGNPAAALGRAFQDLIRWRQHRSVPRPNAEPPPSPRAGAGCRRRRPSSPSSTPFGRRRRIGMNVSKLLI
jgi:hypothetical protein